MQSAIDQGACDNPHHATDEYVEDLPCAGMAKEWCELASTIGQTEEPEQRGEHRTQGEEGACLCVVVCSDAPNQDNGIQIDVRVEQTKAQDRQYRVAFPDGFLFCFLCR